MRDNNKPQDILAAARKHYEEIICPNVDEWESTAEYP